MLKKNRYYVVGVMSGTSMDGIDLALMEFFFKMGKWEYNYLSTTTNPYSNSWKEKLSGARFLKSELLSFLNEEYTDYLANQIQIFINQNAEYSIDLVCSHGHTVHHQPDQGFTLQIGNLKKLSTLLNTTVVCDFRVQDVALGGQGAPLVPGGEFFLFQDYSVCVNLGGFANISLLGEDNIIAFDIAAANLVFNAYAEKRNLSYDADGAIARKGSVIFNLLEQLNALDYYQKSFPKSLGIEWIGEKLDPVLDRYKHKKLEDLMHTYSVHLATQILNVLPKSGKILFTGGGTHNLFLMEQIKKISTAQIDIPSLVMIDYKEAMVFGFLGLLKYLGKDNCFASVTGATHNHSSGVIFNHN